MSIAKSLSLVALSVVLSVSSILGFTSYHQRVANDVSLLRQSTYLVTIGEVGNCSAVLIEDGKLLTAAHCVVPDQKLSVDGKEATVLKVDEVHDLALLAVDLTCPCVPVADKSPSLDSPVTVVGFPMGVTEVVTKGYVQDKPITNDYPEEVLERIGGYMVVSAQVAPGNSGGPVFQFQDGEWKVVGITSAVAVASIGGFIPNLIYHVAFAVNLDTLKAFLS